jgi:serine/threonine protein kinase
MTQKLDRYQILEEVGQGGFATVYRAHDTELDRFVAVKELKPALIQDTNWIKRFQREARAIARLDHSHIITVHDVIQEDNRFLIVMRLVNGPSLDQYITTQGKVSWNETLAHLDGIAAGLDYAHLQEILHRDLKPANILMDPQRGPMLSDFGLAKLMGTNASSVTVSGSIAGTPHYIAPEVWEAQPATPQTDIYALGCIVYEMLTGVKLFKGETPPAVMMAHFKPLELPDTWADDVPPAVANVLYTALATNPTDRYASAQEMVEAMKNLSPDDPVAPHPNSVEMKPDTTSTMTEGSVQDLVRQVTRQVVAETKRDQAASWQHEAENALTEGNLASAERAARKWNELHPDDPELAAFLQRLEERKTQTGDDPEATVELTETPVPTTPEAMHTKKIRMKKGCLRKIIFVTILILALIGAGTVCSQCSYFHDITKNVQTGPTEIEVISIPQPDGNETPELKISFGTGNLFIAPGANEELVEGTAKYNTPMLKPEVITRDNNITLQHVDYIDTFLGFLPDEVENEWILRLNDTPMALNVRTDGSEGQIELGGLSITDLNVTQGISGLRLSFSEPNKVEMDKLLFKAGASDGTFSNLANANTGEIIFLGGAGNYKLDFGGQLQTDLDASVEVGLGATTLVVPQGTPATVSFEGTAHGIVAEGDWEEVNGEYVMAGEGPRIKIFVSMGPGELKLQN